jgi:hypothetical protein
MVDRCDAGQADRDVNCQPIRGRHSVEQRRHDRRRLAPAADHHRWIDQVNPRGEKPSTIASLS